MGMDVFGKNPVNETGEYFRNNVWWWRPLWNYCYDVAPHLLIGVSGSTNDGDGLEADDTQELVNILKVELEAGRTLEYQTEYNAELANLPRQDCELCETTGIRSDEVGFNAGMDKRELSPEVQILTGRTHGWCNACDGIGTKENWSAGYPFSVENVQEFVDFLASSGGFEIC
jgi:hypothetical protein